MRYYILSLCGTEKDQAIIKAQIATGGAATPASELVTNSDSLKMKTVLFIEDSNFFHYQATSGGFVTDKFLAAFVGRTTRRGSWQTCLGGVDPR